MWFGTYNPPVAANRAGIEFVSKLWRGQTLCVMHVIVHITQYNIITLFAFSMTSSCSLNRSTVEFA